MSIKPVPEAANLNVCGGVIAEQRVLDFVFLQLADELFVGHVIDLRKIVPEGLCNLTYAQNSALSEAAC